MMCCTTGSADAPVDWGCGSTAVRSVRVGIVRTGVMPGLPPAVFPNCAFCKPYRAASASLAGFPGVTPADPNLGVVGAGTIPGAGRPGNPAGVGSPPGTPCAIDGL